MKNIKIIVFVINLLLIPTFTYANGTEDYLILQDIGSYLWKNQGKDFITGQIRSIPGYTIRSASGILTGADHFDLDHDDSTYETKYVNRSVGLGVEVQVTKHAGSDSDQWLLHEVERDFRTYYGIPGDSYVMRVVNGNTIMAVGSGGWTYRWLSSDKVIHIEYTDLQMEKPEPLEVVSAYLAKHPSTLTPMTSANLRTDANKTTWIKDEMDRRLWLGGKWMGQIKTAGDLDKLRDVVKNLNIFLDYREKYFGIETGAEKNALFTAQQSKNKAAIEEKLNDYYKWWNKNKDKPINL